MVSYMQLYYHYCLIQQLFCLYILLRFKRTNQFSNFFPGPIFTVRQIYSCFFRQIVFLLVKKLSKKTKSFRVSSRTKSAVRYRIFQDSLQFLAYTITAKRQGIEKRFTFHNATNLKFFLHCFIGMYTIWHMSMFYMNCLCHCINPMLKQSFDTIMLIIKYKFRRKDVMEQHKFIGTFLFR